MRKLFVVLSTTVLFFGFSSAGLFNQLEESIQSSVDALEEKLSTQYPLFYEECVIPEWNEESALIDEDEDSPYFLSPQGCNGQYETELTIVNNILSKILDDTSDYDEELTMEDITMALGIVTMLIEILEERRNEALAANRLPAQIDIMFSAMIYYFEIAKLGLNIMTL